MPLAGAESGMPQKLATWGIADSAPFTHDDRPQVLRGEFGPGVQNPSGARGKLRFARAGCAAVPNGRAEVVAAPVVARLAVLHFK